MNEDKLIVNARTANLEDADYTLTYLNTDTQTTSAAGFAGLVKYLNNTLTNNTILNIVWRRDTDITTSA